MKRILFIALFLAVIQACAKKYEDVKDPGWNENKINNTLTVMSYNVKYCSPYKSNKANVEAIAEVIKKAQPDVVFFQEIDKNTTRSGKKDQLKILSEKTDMPFMFYGKAINYQGGQSGLGILSKYQLENTQRHELPRIELEGKYVSYRILLTANIKIKEQFITIANTHLELTQENRDLQVPEINKILSKSDYPVIFGGDFNATPNNYTMKTFFDYGFTKTCKLNCNTIPAVNPNREIDFILTRPSKKFDVISHEIINSQASDHLPIVSVLKIKQ